MSNGEINRLSVIQSVLEKRVTQRQASEQLGITERQLRRLVARYRNDGASGLVSKKRGGTGNRSTSAAIKDSALAAIRDVKRCSGHYNLPANKPGFSRHIQSDDTRAEMMYIGQKMRHFCRQWY